MRYLSWVLTLLAFVLIASPASADEESGLTFWFEYRNLELSSGGDDDLTMLGPAIGYSHDFDGVFAEFGFRVDHFMLDRPSVEGVTFYEGCPTPPDHPFPEAQSAYTLDPEFTYWGVGPMLGASIPIIQEWIGVSLMASATFPITNDSEGWGFEGTAYGSFTFYGLLGLDLAILGGGKFGSIHHTADRFEIEENRMMPVIGARLRVPLE